MEKKPMRGYDSDDGAKKEVKCKNNDEIFLSVLSKVNPNDDINNGSEC